MILSPILGSPDDDQTDDDHTASKNMHLSSYANDLDYSDEDNNFLLNNDELNNGALMIEYMDTKKRKYSVNGNRQRRGNLIWGGPECRDTTNMTEDEKRNYRKTHKEYMDQQRIEPEGIM
jgi:hypothetical protein